MTAMTREGSSGGSLPGSSPALQPGQVAISADLEAVSAVVSSGVVVYLGDGRIGGVGYFSMPGGLNGMAKPRYGDVVLGRLLDRMLSAGAAATNLAAIVFGGATAHPAFPPAAASLGSQNVDFALHWLNARGIPIRAKDAGGKQPRRVRFRLRLGTYEAGPVQLLQDYPAAGAMPRQG